jgi:thiosulfate reductase cytochrome b subunit
MAETIAPSEGLDASARAEGHARWVRICHWTVAAGILTLAFSGSFILMTHPRLYWGEVGNDLVPALIELPISDNHRPEAWQKTIAFAEGADAPFSANRTYEIFNPNSWGRSLHFMAAWVFVVGWLIYALVGIVGGHLWRDLLPRVRELVPRELWGDVMRHIRRQFGRAGGGPPYGLLQRCAYVSVAFIVLPLMVLTGLTMSPKVTAAYPVLLDVFGGYQSARTVHFFGFAALMMFLVVHVVMVMMTGLRQQLRAMIVGR